EHHGTVLDRGGERIALGLEHVGGDRSLVAVLAAAEVEEVVVGGVQSLAWARGRVGELDAPPLAAPAQEEDVAAVGVDVHLIGVEGEAAELHYGLLSRTTTVEPT